VKNPSWTRVQLYRKVKGRYTATWPCEKEKAPEVPVGEWVALRLDWKDGMLVAYVNDSLALQVVGVAEPAGTFALRAGKGTRVRFRNVRVARPKNMPKPPAPRPAATTKPAATRKPAAAKPPAPTRKPAPAPKK
jgi:hypothetical protein